MQKKEETQGPFLTVARGNRNIGKEFPVFFIAEIGQNHQGSIDIAKKLIDEAKECGADCVKFQKTNLNEKFTKKVLEKPYDSPNSFGKTYGEHKQKLEFSCDQFIELQKYAASRDILFSASAMDIDSFRFLEKIKVSFIKIGSGDANNVQLLKLAAKSPISLVISTGMLPFSHVKFIYELLKKNGKTNFALLHCVSSYPTPVEDINLRVIELYKKNFPDIIIGYSGHEIGIDVPIAATVLGARIIEKHITFNNGQKGSDHCCSLMPEEFREMVEKTRKLELAMGIPKKIQAPSERACWLKLGKCLVSAKMLKAGHRFKDGDVKAKVTDSKDGLNAIHYETVIGSLLARDLNTDDPISCDDCVGKIKSDFCMP